MRFMFETENNSVEFANENGSNYISTEQLESSDLVKIQTLLTELDSYFPKPRMKEILSVNANLPTDLGIEYMAVNVVDINLQPITLYYSSIAKIESQKLIMDTFFDLFPEFKAIQVTQMSPAIFVVDGVESNFEDYDDLQKDAINAMGVMLTRLINS